ncbi:MAG: helix-turn-helix transcriptional regulator [Bdellovibrionales bacterium]|jgi:DNA-binding XRE family transcriptional regulator
MITGRQIRAARALLDMSQDDLANAAGLTKQGISKIEDGSVQPREGTIADIMKVFREKGIEFTENQGVRLYDHKVREIDGPNCYALLLDEIYYQLQKGEEFFVCMADESLSPQEVHEAFKRIVRKGIKYKKLIKEGNNHIRGPLDWYRQIPSRYYQNAASVFFDDICAYLTEDFQKVIVVHDKAIAQANKNFFDLVWSQAKSPKGSNTNEKYE